MKIRILIIEDDLDWSTLVENNFQASFLASKLKCKITVARTIQDARNSVRTNLFQAMSIDQNMPEVTGGDVSTQHGTRFAESVAEAGIPIFASIYTAFGDENIANKIGRKTGFEYKLKSTETDAERMAYEPDAYADWFVASFKQEYLRKVLKQVTLSGHSDLAQYANLALREYDDAVVRRKDDAMSRFMNRLQSVRELLLVELCAFTVCVAAHEGKPIKKRPDIAIASKTESWLHSEWLSLESTASFKKIKQYFGLENETLYAHYINPLSNLRLLRNRHVHNSILDYTSEDYERHFLDILTLADLTNYIVTRPMVFRPVSERENIVSYTELNRTYFEPREMIYNQNLPTDDRGTVYTILAPDEPIISLTPGYTAEKASNNRYFLKRVDM